MNKILLTSKKRIGITITTSFVLVALLVISSLAIVTLSSAGVANAARAPSPPSLSSTVCASIGGTWALKPATCTVSGTGEATTSFVIPTKFSLVVTGALTVDSGVTITNSGNITIRNTAGDYSRGITNDGTLANAASGVIIVANSGETSVGIYNHRTLDEPSGGFVYHLATITNAGSITINNSGNNSFGIYSSGFLTNSGVLTINSLSGTHLGTPDLNATGIYNSGSFTNTDTGTFYNYDGYVDSTNQTKIVWVWGNFNDHGTMINYGTTFTNGTFFTDGYTMINYGTINSTSTGVWVDIGPSYGSTMINYGTFYNYGTIVGGENKGICYNEPPSGSGCGKA